MMTRYRLLSFAFICLGTVSTGCSGLYPRARALREASPDGGLKIRITYPSTKTFQHRAACNVGRCAVLFAIRDSIGIGFPPPGATLDDRLMYYLASMDREVHSSGSREAGLKDVQPLLFDDFSRGGEGLSGTADEVFAYAGGFIVTYNQNRDFFFATFDNEGNPLVKRRLFFTSQETVGERARIMAVDFHDGAIYLFLVEPDPDALGRWSLNLVRHHTGSGETAVIRNIVSREAGWYYTENLATLFQGNALYLSWMEGSPEKGTLPGTYTLRTSFHFSRCAEVARCDVPLHVHLPASGAWNDSRLALRDGPTGVELVMKSGGALWMQSVGPGGEPMGPPSPLPAESGDPFARLPCERCPPVHVTLGAE